jgi:hypothetical protein
VSAPSKRVWFLDTSSLLSMTLDEDIEAAILDEIGDDPVMFIDIVHDELTRLAAFAGTAGLAKTALNRFRPHWTVMDTSRFVTVEQIQLAQEDVADGRTLTDDMQHWAESTIIAAEAAAELGEILHAAGRGPAVTASDFADPTGRGLGRVAKP